LKPAQTALIALAALAALGLGVFTASRLYGPGRAAEITSGTLLREPRPVAPFSLNDQDGQPWGNAQLEGHWTVLFPGFTHCPDVCPTTLGLMKQLGARLRAGGGTVEFVFLSVDPERDTPAQLKAYVGHFDPTIRGVTGPREQIDTLCAALGLAYLKIPGATDTDYTIDHTAALVLLDPRGRIAGYFQAPHKLDTLAADLAGIVASGT
jgi:protein SCO1/2